MTTTPWSAEESTERFNYLLERISKLEAEVEKLKDGNIFSQFAILAADEPARKDKP